MKISIGSPVTGEDFFDREKGQALVWRKLEKDVNKTSSLQNRL